MKIAFTGHRPDKLGGYQPDNPTEQRVRLAITCALERRANENAGDVTVISGMAIGVDQWAAEAAIMIGLPFIAAVPFPGQESRWPTATQQKYRDLLSQAKEVVIIHAGGYANWAFEKRNHWMVDNSDVLMAVWDGTPGGTANCMTYAFKKKRTIERLEW